MSRPTDYKERYDWAQSLPLVDYPYGTARYDIESDAYYNENGRRLRDPSEYDRNSEGYTPFGDEGW
jgi:hypothetical protein